MGSLLRESTCIFTGHREIPIQHMSVIEKSTVQAIQKLIEHNGVRFFGVGGAVGYDTLAANILFHLRATEYPNIKVILVYPFDGYTRYWTEDQQYQYNKLFSLYDKKVCISPFPSKAAYLMRNRHLVDGASYCIAYCTKPYGGTAYTLQYASNYGLQIINVAP